MCYREASRHALFSPPSVFVARAELQHMHRKVYCLPTWFGTDCLRWRDCTAAYAAAMCLTRKGSTFLEFESSKSKSQVAAAASLGPAAYSFVGVEQSIPKFGDDGTRARSFC